MPGKRWTPGEVHTLVWGWGQRDPHEIAAELGRSVAACRAKVKHWRRSQGWENPTGSPFVGTESLGAFCRRTGYNRQQVLRAMRAMRVWSVPRFRHGRNKRWLISEEMADRICTWLATDGGTSYGLPPGRWAKQHDRCVRCKRTDSPHRRRGLCRRCLQREWAAEPTGEVRACEECGEAFQVIKGQPRQRLCSNECGRAKGRRTRRGEGVWRLRRTGEHRPCEWCGEAFAVTNGQPRQRFCSRQCANEWARCCQG